MKSLPLVCKQTAGLYVRRSRAMHSRSVGQHRECHSCCFVDALFSMKQYARPRSSHVAGSHVRRFPIVHVCSPLRSHAKDCWSRCRAGTRSPYIRTLGSGSGADARQPASSTDHVTTRRTREA